VDRQYPAVSLDEDGVGVTFETIKPAHHACRVVIADRKGHSTPFDERLRVGQRVLAVHPDDGNPAERTVALLQGLDSRGKRRQFTMTDRAPISHEKDDHGVPVSATTRRSPDVPRNVDAREREPRRRTTGMRRTATARGADAREESDPESGNHNCDDQYANRLSPPAGRYRRFSGGLDLAQCLVKMSIAMNTKSNVRYVIE
jgi:hypothetical protein